MSMSALSESLSRSLLKMAGWTVQCTVPDYPKSIICVAPHTSNWDFILGKLAYASLGRKSGFLMKSSWFFFPLGIIFRAIGGVPVTRKPGSELTRLLTERFKRSKQLTIAITPEGTRSKTTKWHTGFLHIAHDAEIPIILGAIDFRTKTIFLDKIYISTGNVDYDLQIIKDFYKPFEGKYPEKFSTD